MEIKLHNSLTHKTETFKPLEGNLARVYSCGPTVYNYAHIGNMRAFLFSDLLQRVLRVVGGYDVRWAMNLTNIDDKTIRDSAKGSPAWKKEMGDQTDDPAENLAKLTAYYEKAFKDDIGKLGFKLEHFYEMPRATEYIAQMQDLIRSIVKNGFGYVSGGSVYFDVSKWSRTDYYGKLHKIDLDNFRKGVRIDADQYEREEASDFVLWKALKPGEPFWNFEIDGQNLPGRPGWHIECSAMGKDLLGVPFDIHTGGIDLKFPHHEDEIAQSKAGYGVEPVAVWCHNEFLEVEGEKMSKSKGNFFTLRELLDKGIDPLDIRYAMLASHYGSTFNFTFKGIEAAHKGRFRIQEYIYDLMEEGDGAETVDIEKLQNDAFRELGNDLHTPKALAHVFTFINHYEAKKLSPGSKKEAIEFFRSLNEIFDVWTIEPRPEDTVDIPEEVIRMADARILARKEKDFAQADALRDKIKEAGYVVMDTKDSYELKKV